MSNNNPIEQYLRKRIKQLNDADAEFCGERWEKGTNPFRKMVAREQSNQVTFARQELEEVLKVMGLPRFASDKGSDGEVGDRNSEGRLTDITINFKQGRLYRPFGHFTQVIHKSMTVNGKTAYVFNDCGKLNTQDDLQLLLKVYEETHAADSSNVADTQSPQVVEESSAPSPDSEQAKFICKGCKHVLPISYSLRTEGYCYLCDPSITTAELLANTPSPDSGGEWWIEKAEHQAFLYSKGSDVDNNKRAFIIGAKWERQRSQAEIKKLKEDIDRLIFNVPAEVERVNEKLAETLIAGARHKERAEAAESSLSTLKGQIPELLKKYEELKKMDTEDYQRCPAEFKDMYASSHMAFEMIISDLQSLNAHAPSLNQTENK